MADEKNNPIKEKTSVRLDRTLKADDVELVEAVQAERQASRDASRVNHTQPIHFSQTKVSLDPNETQVKGGQTVIKNSLETVIQFVHNELMPDKPSSTSSIALNRNGRITDSLPEIDLAPPDMDSLPMLADNFEIIKRFAKGGQGVLAQARDKVLKRIVAVKSLRTEHLSKDEIRRTFIEEALITAQLEHPAIVSIYSLLRDEKNGIHLSMKLLRGKTLNEYLENVQQSYVKGTTTQWNFNSRIKGNLMMFQKICEALAYAHSRKVIHCDLKPDNIMLGEYGEVFVMDWGLAKKLDERKDLGKNGNGGKPKLDGTPRFIPPEAYAGVPRDERADIFALGLILFEIVTLRRGYDGHTIKEVIHQIRAGERNRIEHRFGFHIDRDLIAIIDKATAYDPSDRYQTVQEFINDILRFQNDDETDARPDNSFRFLSRYLRRHSKMVVILALLGIISAGMVRLVDSNKEAQRTEENLRYKENEVNLLKEKTETRIYDDWIQSYDGLNNLNASRISSWLLTFTNGLSNIATQSATFLEMKEPVNYPGALPIYPIDEVRDRDSRYSVAYNRPIGLDFCSYQQPPNQNREVTEDLIRRLRPVARQLQQLVLSSQLTRSTEEDEQELRRVCADIGMPIFQAYIALEDSHIQICYPGHDAYSKDYDNHTRVWYKDAKKQVLEEKNLVPHWCLPYLDNTTGYYAINCTVPIVGRRGQFLGACSFKMRLSSFEEMLRGGRGQLDDTTRQKNITLEAQKSDFYKNVTLEHWLVTNNGDILYHKNLKPILERERYLEPEQGPVMRYLPPPIQLVLEDIFKKDSSSYYGSKEFMENGYRITYHYAFIEQLNAYLVKKTTRERIFNGLKQAGKMQRDAGFRGLPLGH